MKIEKCPVCGSAQWRYVSYAEECWGTVEQHGKCSRCGYTIEQCYSDTITGFELSRTKGYKINKTWHGKNIRKRKRMKRKYHIRHNPDDWMLDYI